MFQNLTGSTTQISLTALRAFEAMARTGSATAAAAELHVTHSAISRQVKSLEQQLGTRLFEGPKHALRLTPRGAKLAAELHPAFDRIAAAVTHAKGQSDELSVAVHPSLAVKWLIPRLGAFHQAHPDIHIHLIELPTHAETHRGADVVIRLMDDDRMAASGAIKLMDNATGPVFSTSLKPAGEPLAELPRLAARTQPDGWARWSRNSGMGLPPSGPPRLLAHLHFVLDAALSGWGCAVLPWVLVADAVRDGRLQAPYGFAPDGGGVAIMLSGSEPSRAQRVFHRRLQEEARGLLPAPENLGTSTLT
ncbi:LysR family transcriptional regulator [uncultured Brevundimonas sp.]|uniref:LysR family transcriptional regulator n=1 Tax=uncultured Brevundimonas sp. TaxID=213418 RepID=UPI002632619A|nr:LysR family transcriptional regulator [uncultured Brevundimonas sp.]